LQLTPRTWFGGVCIMRWGNGNACEVQVRKAVGIHFLKNSRCRSDGDISAVPKEPGNGAVDWIHLA